MANNYVQRVLIVESLPVIAYAIESLLYEISNMHIVVNTSASLAIETIQCTAPFDLFFIDLDLLDSCGFSLVRQLAHEKYADRCIAISSFNKSQWIAEMRALGMLGYILKTASMQEFQHAIQSVTQKCRCFPYDACGVIEKVNTKNHATTARHARSFAAWLYIKADCYPVKIKPGYSGQSRHQPIACAKCFKPDSRSSQSNGAGLSQFASHTYHPTQDIQQ